MQVGCAQGLVYLLSEGIEVLVKQQSSALVTARTQIPLQSLAVLMFSARHALSLTLPSTLLLSFSRLAMQRACNLSQSALSTKTEI